MLLVLAFYNTTERRARHMWAVGPGRLDYAVPRASTRCRCVPCACVHAGSCGGRSPGGCSLGGDPLPPSSRRLGGGSTRCLVVVCAVCTRTCGFMRGVGARVGAAWVGTPSHLRRDDSAMARRAAWWW